jgi:mycoredoxin
MIRLNAFKYAFFVVEFRVNKTGSGKRERPVDNLWGSTMADIKVYITSWSTDCNQAKEFLDDEGIFYEEIDIEQFPEAARLVEGANGGRRIVPTFSIDGTVFSLKPFDWRKLQSELERLGVEEDE